MRAPGVWTLEGLFAARAEALALFNVVRAFIESLGPVTMDVSKTQVAFGRGRKFAWVWLPQMWIKKRPDESVTLVFDYPYRIRHRRIASAVEPRPGRWTHHVLIDREADLDERVRSWLRQAYDLAGSSLKRRTRPS